jgi:hypothetical protein
MANPMHMLRGFTVLMVAALSMTPRAYSQAIDESYSKTWDLFEGVSAACIHSSNPMEHEYEWISSATQRPYPSHPSVGGTIEASGILSSSSTTGSAGTAPDAGQLSTVMGGPSVIFPTHGIQPFVRALFGVSVQKPHAAVSGSGVGVNSTTNAGYFGLALGGGFDVPIASAVSVRAQVDWLHAFISSTDNSYVLRASIGIVLRY